MVCFQRRALFLLGTTLNVYILTLAASQSTSLHIEESTVRVAPVWDGDCDALIKIANETTYIKKYKYKGEECEADKQYLKAEYKKRLELLDTKMALVESANERYAKCSEMDIPEMKKKLESVKMKKIEEEQMVEVISDMASKVIGDRKYWLRNWVKLGEAVQGGVEDVVQYSQKLQGDLHEFQRRYSNMRFAESALDNDTEKIWALQDRLKELEEKKSYQEDFVTNAQAHLDILNLLIKAVSGFKDDLIQDLNLNRIDVGCDQFAVDKLLFENLKDVLPDLQNPENATTQTP